MKCDGLRIENACVYGPDEKVYLAEQVDAAIAEIKAELDKTIAERDGNQVCIDALKQKLEDAKATHYAESVDAGMENRKLKRALWLARANDASSLASLFSTLSDIEDDESRTYWIFGNKRKIVIDKLKCHRMETSYTWFRIWDNVADKCLNKMEDYK